MTARPDTITYGNDVWHSSSGQLPYAYALRHAWLCMIREEYGEDAQFGAFFHQIPTGMFLDIESSKPLVAPSHAVGHLGENAELHFTATQTAHWVEFNDVWGHYPAQTIITLGLDPYPNHVQNCFSTVIFNSSCTFNEGFQDLHLHGATAMAQSGFELGNERAEHFFRAAVQPLKLAGHPLLKHYRI